jgi:hypothetical protein
MTKRDILVCAAIALSSGFIGALLVRSFPPIQGVFAAGSWSARKFYLTKAAVTGDKPLTACAVGYHMANLAEVFNPSTLQYDTTLGYQEADSGSGPPWYQWGWIRTGRGKDAGVSAATGGGMQNCSLWTSNSHSNGGSAVSLDNWYDGQDPNRRVALDNQILPWTTRRITVGGSNNDQRSFCDVPLKVWCVQD